MTMVKVVVTNGKRLFRTWNPTIDHVNALRRRLGRDTEERRPLSPAEFYGKAHKEITRLMLMIGLSPTKTPGSRPCWYVGSRLNVVEDVIGRGKPDQANDPYMFWLGDPRTR